MNKCEKKITVIEWCYVKCQINEITVNSFLTCTRIKYCHLFTQTKQK